MLRRLSHFWPSVRWCAVNLFIATLLALMLLDGLPFVPPRVRASIDTIVDVAGIWQAGWSMFAPVADNGNTRYSADIEYADGTIAHWRSPDWPNMPRWERFFDSRYFEFVDNTTVESNIDAWPGLADHIARIHPPPRPNAKLRRVTIWAETATIEDPEIWGWRPRASPHAFGKRYLFHEQEYP